ncbi:hypothetical protein B0H11DRAFT_1928660 [Mycena galericulata]|nr:hypothetical protein B0H11DRAFT_1928660 [Mycena galericulata]
MFCSAALFGKTTIMARREHPPGNLQNLILWARWNAAQIEYCLMSIPVSVASLGSPFQYRPPLEKHEPYKRHYQARRRGSSGRTDPLEFMKSTTEFLRDLNDKRHPDRYSPSRVTRSSINVGKTNSKVAPPAAVLNARDPDPSESQIPNSEEPPFDVCPHGIRRVKVNPIVSHCPHGFLRALCSGTFALTGSGERSAVLMASFELLLPNRYRLTFALTGLGVRRWILLPEIKEMATVRHTWEPSLSPVSEVVFFDMGEWGQYVHEVWTRPYRVDSSSNRVGPT